MARKINTSFLFADPYLRNMIITPAELTALETFFASVEIPRTIRLNQATTCSNTPAFVRQVLDNLKRSDISDVALRPRYEDLLIIKRLIEQAPSGEAN